MPSLQWRGKESVINHHREVPYHLLQDEAALSEGEPGSGNLLVEGDNLLALKALLPYYAGQVKCIYIDPPYNTGNEGWVYNDNVNSPDMRKWLGETVGRDDLTRHDKWLCMMYPRLVLLRQFLREDGAIFISIDDNEVAHLRCVMDEIFGERNFIANVVWQKKQSPQNDAINLSDMHDHILVYARRAKANRIDPEGWQRNLVLRGDAQDQRYTNPDDDPRGPWTSADYTCNKTADERPNLYYPITNPDTGEELWPSRRRVWAFDPSAHEHNAAENRIWWGSNGKGRPRIKKFRSEVAEGIVPSTWWTRELAGDNQESRRELRSLLPEANVDFSTPKPSRLVRRILELATCSQSLILDSFAGSGTTGHAVMQLNKEDGGSRRFILVEMESDICRNITAERLRRAINGYGNVESLGGGFRYATLGDTLFDKDGRIRQGVVFNDLARHVFFSETGAPMPSGDGPRSPLIGVHNGIAYYLLFNGVLGDKRVNGGNVLTKAILSSFPPHNGPRVVIGEGCRLADSTLKRSGIVFKQIPYQIEVDG
ncbi:MAG: site-specific DNA-methyltransferase [Armatimonadetes bacterium]|nr:site-specific DNA-methyltransferase [Armatimonadota bacterium]